MDQLPPDFAETLAQVLEPGHQAAVAGILEAATGLDDDGLRVFLEMFGARIRASPAAVRQEELHAFLKASKEGGRGGAP
jgi:hypothetical protein